MKSTNHQRIQYASPLNRQRAVKTSIEGRGQRQALEDRLIDEAMSGAQNQTRADYAIHYGGSFTGVIGLGSMDHEQQTAWLAYWVGVPFWRRGIATAALQQILAMASPRFNLQRIYTGVWRQNEGSKRVLSKQGFVVSRADYQAEHYHDKFNRDTVLEMIYLVPTPSLEFSSS